MQQGCHCGRHSKKADGQYLGRLIVFSLHSKLQRVPHFYFPPDFAHYALIEQILPTIYSVSSYQRNIRRNSCYNRAHQVNSLRVSGHRSRVNIARERRGYKHYFHSR